MLSGIQPTHRERTKAKNGNFFTFLLSLSAGQIPLSFRICHTPAYTYIYDRL